MNLQEFGQTIKKKYPQYNNIEDVDLAKKIIEKYPQYQSKITKKEENDKGFWEKFGDWGNSTAQKLTDTFISPFARELERPFVSGIRQFQGEDKRNKPMNTPFGDVSPYWAMSNKEAVGGITELGLSVLPIEKLLSPVWKGTKNLGKKMLFEGGEVLTGVESKRLDDWFRLAKDDPKRLERTKELVNLNPDNPYLPMAEKISGKIGGVKEEARTMFSEAVENVRKDSPDRVFNISKKMPELNETLNKYRLKVDRVKDGGAFTKNIKVNPSVRNSAYTPKDIQMVDDLVQRMNLEDMNVDELLEFEEGVKRFFDYASKNENKRLMSLGYELIEESSKYIDEVFPEVAEANKKYRDYYDLMKKTGNKLMDSEGNIKQGAEGFLGNSVNFNKGATRKDLVEASKKLGIDIVDDVENIRNYKQLTEKIPNTTKSRVSAIFRGVISSEAFRVGAGAGAYFNPVVGVPALIANVLASPTRYRNLIEIIADTSNKVPLTEQLKKLNPTETRLIQNVIKSMSKDNTTNEAQEEKL
jgi:hypothetical protein